MKHNRTWRDLHIEEIEFIKNANNVYRTKKHIVAQRISPVVKKKEMITLLCSEDRYYLRTEKRDAEYDLYFESRGASLEGKRIQTALYTRKYISQFK